MFIFAEDHSVDNFSYSGFQVLVGRLENITQINITFGEKIMDENQTECKGLKTPHSPRAKPPQPATPPTTRTPSAHAKRVLLNVLPTFYIPPCT